MVFRAHKYNAKPTVVDGYKFASKKEAARYSDLRLLERAGEIQNLCLQVRFPLEVNGKTVGYYRADFTYLQDGKKIVEDVKGMALDVYRLKKKIFEAQYGLQILET